MVKIQGFLFRLKKPLRLIVSKKLKFDLHAEQTAKRRKRMTTVILFLQSLLFTF